MKNYIIIVILILFTSCITINKYYTYPTVTKEIEVPNQNKLGVPNYTLPIYRGKPILIDTLYNKWYNDLFKDTIINVHPIYIK